MSWLQYTQSDFSPLSFPTFRISEANAVGKTLRSYLVTRHIFNTIGLFAKKGPIHCSQHLNQKVAWFEYILCEYSPSFNILFIFILNMTRTKADLIVMVALGKPSIKEVKMGSNYKR